MIQDANCQTVGKAALDLLKKPSCEQGVLDTSREMLKGYFDNLILAVESGRKQFGEDKPFYICVQTRRERLLENVIRNQFYCRQTRPAPAYDLALYWYDPKDENLQFVWCIPDPQTVETLIENQSYVPQEEQMLVWFCKCFKDGTLI